MDIQQYFVIDLAIAMTLRACMGTSEQSMMYGVDEDYLGKVYLPSGNGKDDMFIGYISELTFTDDEA